MITKMKEKEIFTSVKPEIVIAQLFQSRDMMHIVHLQTTSYAEHKALNAYYNGLLDLVDDLIESYFGCIGKRLAIKIPASEYVNPNLHLNQMKEYMMKHRTSFGTDRTHIQNIIDEIIALITKTQYLLTLT
jgi:hypothetical protein